MCWCVISLSAPARVRQSQIRMSTNRAIFTLFMLWSFEFAALKNGKRGRDREWEKESRKTERFANCTETLKRIYQNIVFRAVEWNGHHFIIYCLFVPTTQCKYLLEEKCVTFLLTLSRYDSTWFQVMFHIFISFQRFSLFRCSMTFEKYVKFWHIPTYPHWMCMYFYTYTMMDGDQVYVCAGKLSQCVYVSVWLDLCYSHFSHNLI